MSIYTYDKISEKLPQILHLLHLPYVILYTSH